MISVPHLFASHSQRWRVILFSDSAKKSYVVGENIRVLILRT